ncbi:replication initiator [Kitasatospora sp. NPDC059327]|uniref:replication initiator n=1 Tax=Kitasatospora sp. NPDC059327 TaxID=3346803 RepID=UPI003676D18B
MIRTCWDLGRRVTDFADLKLTKWAHMLGFRGHFSTKSRRYSTTLGTLRGVRRTWQSEQARIRAGHPPLDPDSTLVVSDWRYLATGYTPGEELLAQVPRSAPTSEPSRSRRCVRGAVPTTGQRLVRGGRGGGAPPTPPPPQRGGPPG